MTRWWKQFSLSLLTVACLLFWMGPAAQARTFYGNPNWQVSFKDKIEMNFMSNEIAEILQDIEPGDGVVLSIKVTNLNTKSVDWYMKNDVIRSQEDGTIAEGGAYTYKLTYKPSTGTEKVLYDSEAVGGESSSPAGEGLHQATDGLKDYFYLDTQKTNQSGTVTLEIVTDGEGQTNFYQNTLADLLMNFAVELNTDDTQNRTHTQVVRTGDETQLFPLYTAMTVSGLLLLVLGVYSVKKDKRKRGDR